MSIIKNFLYCALLIAALCLFLTPLTVAFQSPLRSSSLLPRTRLSMSTPTYKVPLELQSKIDPSRTWDVTFIWKGQEKVVNVPEALPLLTSGNKIFNDELPFSCLNGVCMTCACQVEFLYWYFRMFFILGFRS